MSLFLFLALMVGACGYALVRGGAPERIAALLQALAFFSGLPLHLTQGATEYQVAGMGTVAVDIALLIALTLLAYRSTRFWPLWLAGWQFATIVAHLAKMLDPEMKAAGYAIQAQIWAYPMLIAMAVGTFRHQMRLRAGDPDPPWKQWSALIPSASIGNQR